VSAVATSEGVRIGWEAPGAGPPLLALHGLGYGRWGWEPVRDLLTERCTLLLVDNRGIGASDAPPGPYTARQMAADAVAVLDAAGVERAAVMGASLGGMIAQELALGWPERVARLVLVASTPGGAQSFPLPAATARLLAGAGAGTNGAAAEGAGGRGDEARDEGAPSLRDRVANALAPGAPEALVARIVAHRERAAQDSAAWRAQAAAAQAFDAFARLPRIAAPTLVVHGEADAVVDVRNAGLLAERIPHARAVTLPDAGHLLFWEQPERFVALVSAFLAEEDA
jgi:3-oxoadipate enol-lactonase